MTTSSIFRATRYGALIATALSFVAMLLYPGGTPLNGAVEGYSFFQNSLSDLGGTVAWNGQPNPGWPLHLLASVFLALAGAATLGGLVRVYSASASGRRAASAAAGVVLLACAGLVGAGFAPHDRWPVIHGRFTLLAVGSLPIASLLMFLATARDRRFSRRVPVAWLALTAVVMVWGSMILLPQPATEAALAVPVTLQKAVAAGLVVTILFQTKEADRLSSPNTRRVGGLKGR